MFSGTWKTVERRELEPKKKKIPFRANEKYVLREDGYTTFGTYFTHAQADVATVFGVFGRRQSASDPSTPQEAAHPAWTFERSRLI